MPPRRFIGSIKQCFDDYANKHSGLAHLELLAEFCRLSSQRVGLEIVHRWQRGEYFPGGAELLGVGCFLRLVGYEVEELNRLDDTRRQAALLLGCGVVKPQAMLKKMELEDPKAVWRILLHGEGTSKKVLENIEEVTTERRVALTRKVNAWKKRITAAFPEPGTSEKTEAVLSFTPEMATAFGRSVGATIALARILVNAGEGQSARDATSDGSDMHELLELLQQLTA